MAQMRPAGGQWLVLLEGRSCPCCTDGTLDRAPYMGCDAVVCDRCETPVARLFSDGT